MNGWGPDLTRRHQEVEIMDDPNLDRAAHLHALRGLARINAISGTVRIIWNAIADELKAHREAPLRILDVACGGGDVSIAIAQLAEQAGWPVEVVGCDLSPVAVQDAQEQARRRNEHVTFVQCDVLANQLPAGFDIICCSLFLHHLSELQAVSFLDDARQKARRLVIVSDLNRTRWGYLLARWGGRVLSRSHVVHFDGPISVCAAYSLPEVTQLAQKAGMKSAQIRRRWPARFCLRWNQIDDV